MHVYVQKSTSTTRPRNAASVSGVSPGVLSQSWVSVNSGAAPCPAAAARRRATACARVASPPRAAPSRSLRRPRPVGRRELCLRPVISCSRPVTLLRALKRRRQVDVGNVSGDELVESHVEVRHDRDCREDHHRAQRALEQRPPPALADAVEQSPAAERAARAARPPSRARRRPRSPIVLPDAALTEMTAARIGLAHGVYTKPSAPPTSIPEQKPSPLVRGPKRARRDSGASSRAARPARAAPPEHQQHRRSPRRAAGRFPARRRRPRSPGPRSSP